MKLCNSLFGLFDRIRRRLPPWMRLWLNIVSCKLGDPAEQISIICGAELQVGHEIFVTVEGDPLDPVWSELGVVIEVDQANPVWFVAKIACPSGIHIFEFNPFVIWFRGIRS